jgi:hypothetical protein
LHGANATRLHAIVTDADMVKDTASLQAIASSSKRAWWCWSMMNASQ